MGIFYIILITLFILSALFFISLYICFLITFYVTKKQKKQKDFQIPKGKIYLPYKEKMVSWMKEAKTIPHQDVSIISFDNLTLRGKYYECNKGGIVEIMFHGYRGNSERDLCGGIQRCFALNRNVITVDQRGQASSEGSLITFGALEKLDCLKWVDFAIKKFGNNVKIILSGISMGASTVLLASGLNLPKNVIGIVADCGYTSAEKIIKKVIKDMHLPVFLFYPLINLSAKIFGKFDLKDANVSEALKNTKVPVLLFHGDMDKFVPYYMSEQNFNCIQSEKRLVTVSGAGHGLCYLIDPKGYVEALKEFEKNY